MKFRLRTNWVRPPGPVAQSLRVGLLGGSFNPAHEGHIYASELALKQLQLDYVWWLVAPQNPLKETAGMADPAARLASARATAAHPRIHVTDIEAQLGTRYTVDTLAALLKAYPTTRFIWLMGADNLGGFRRWKQWRRIAHMLPIAVLLRPGYTGQRWSTPTAAWFARFRKPESQARQWPRWRTPALVIVTLPLDARSATAIRAADPDWAETMSLTRQRVPHGCKIR